jgi:hypothetical protein
MSNEKRLLKRTRETVTEEFLPDPGGVDDFDECGAAELLPATPPASPVEGPAPVPVGTPPSEPSPAAAVGEKPAKGK